MVFLFVFSFWDCYDSNVEVFNTVLEVSEIVLISFNSFFFFLSDSFISTILSSNSLILSSASVILRRERGSGRSQGTSRVRMTSQGWRCQASRRSTATQGRIAI